VALSGVCHVDGLHVEIERGLLFIRDIDIDCRLAFLKNRVMVLFTLITVTTSFQIIRHPGLLRIIIFTIYLKDS
jgi:hypothetical protein